MIQGSPILEFHSVSHTFLNEETILGSHYFSRSVSWKREVGDVVGRRGLGLPPLLVFQANSLTLYQDVYKREREILISIFIINTQLSPKPLSQMSIMCETYKPLFEWNNCLSTKVTVKKEVHTMSPKIKQDFCRDPNVNTIPKTSSEVSVVILPFPSFYNSYPRWLTCHQEFPQICLKETYDLLHFVV